MKFYGYYILLGILSFQTTSNVIANNRANFALLLGSGSLAFASLLKAADCQDWLEREGETKNMGSTDLPESSTEKETVANNNLETIKKRRERNIAGIVACASVGLCYVGWSRLE
ncbi:MAG TPA: hypothetical protein VFF04_07225 [Candidatus Babeliales bacterium]|nr:hypothetical protein [Candidatus Babeliales bacterium]